jgi:5-methylcytosine-specific restriction enzyme subunit McrC
MLALLFDMNSLWEEYVLLKLKEATRDLDIEVLGQNRKTFWNGITIRPDIIIKKGDRHCIIDTKWKNNTDNKPSANDLRQMYVYNEYWSGRNALLLYPSATKDFMMSEQFEVPATHSCGIARINVLDISKSLDSKFGSRLLDVLLENNFLEPEFYQ